MRHNLTSEEQALFDTLLQNWGKYITRNRQLSDHYNGKVRVDDLGISIPPPMANKLSGCSMMWSKQAVKRVADASVLEGFRFNGETPAGFDEMMAKNEIVDQYDETLPSELTHGCAFYTVTAGAEGEPTALISSYDAEHASAIPDYRTRGILAGIAIVDVDPKQPNRPTAANFYAPDGTIVEAELGSKGWVTRRLNNGLGRCAMEVMRCDPDKNHPFGKSVLTPSILKHEEEANREFVRMVLNAELFTAPTRWVMGVDEDFFDNDAWTAYLGSIFAISTDGISGEMPKTGQYPQADMSPHINYIRQLANQFAAEASIPIHSLLYTEANPASAEAIEASRNDLIEKVEKVNRLNGHALRNIGLMALSIMEQRPVAELGDVERSLSVKWRNPLHPTLAASADAAQKIAATVPEFRNTPTFWRMLGYDEGEIDSILGEIAIAAAAEASAASASDDGEAI